jgi:hypothetical protein
MSSLVFSNDETGRANTFIVDAESVVAVTQQWATHGRNVVNVNICTAPLKLDTKSPFFS